MGYVLFKLIQIVGYKLLVRLRGSHYGEPQHVDWKLVKKEETYIKDKHWTDAYCPECGGQMVESLGAIECGKRYCPYVERIKQI